MRQFKDFLALSLGEEAGRFEWVVPKNRVEMDCGWFVMGRNGKKLYIVPERKPAKIKWRSASGRSKLVWEKIYEEWGFVRGEVSEYTLTKLFQVVSEKYFTVKLVRVEKLRDHKPELILKESSNPYIF